MMKRRKQKGGTEKEESRSVVWEGKMSQEIATWMEGRPSG